MSENFATSLNAFREAAVNAALYADQGNPGSAATWEAVAVADVWQGSITERPTPTKAEQ